MLDLSSLPVKPIWTPTSGSVEVVKEKQRPDERERKAEHTDFVDTVRVPLPPGSARCPSCIQTSTTGSARVMEECRRSRRSCVRHKVRPRPAQPKRWSSCTAWHPPNMSHHMAQCSRSAAVEKRSPWLREACRQKLGSFAAQVHTTPRRLHDIPRPDDFNQGGSKTKRNLRRGVLSATKYQEEPPPECLGEARRGFGCVSAQVA